jgi:hypothetical protein
MERPGTVNLPFHLGKQFNVVGHDVHDVFQRDSPLFAAADPFEGTFRQIQVLEVFQVFEDGFTDIVGLGPPCTPGELLQALFDGLR